MSAALSGDLPSFPCPVCSRPTEQVGRPCVECLTAFGDMIREGQGTLDPQEFLREQREGDARVRMIMAERQFAIHQTEYTKASQICWLCEQRRTCTRTPQGWECRECEGVT